jgi:Site-specific recombinase XerD
MNKVVYTLVFNRWNKLKSDGTALIQVEARLRQQKKYFSTNVYLRPDQWDRKSKIIKEHPNAEALNHMLYSYIASIEEKELLLWKNGKNITLDALVSVMDEQINHESFISFCYREVLNSSLKESTRKNHLSTIKLIEAYQSQLDFSCVNYNFVCEFDYFLRGKNYHLNTIAKHLKHLKRYVNIAINNDLMCFEQNPFRKYKIKSTENHSTYLSPEELFQLEITPLTGKDIKLRKTLDAFLFCCYTGLRYSDFISLNDRNFILMNNEMWLFYKTVKTKVEVRLPLYLLFEGKCLNILNRYRDGIDAFFSLKDNSNINKELLRISKKAGLSKHISFHTARHTNATLLIYNGLNITTVQKILGHKNIKTTQIYTSVMDMTLVRELERMNSQI